MTTPTYKDNRGKTRAIEIGTTYAASYGRRITVEGFDVRDCGEDDGRTGLPIVYGPMTSDGDTYDGFCYTDDLQYSIPA